MDPHPSPNPNPLIFISSFINHRFSRIAADLSACAAAARRLAFSSPAPFAAATLRSPSPSPSSGETHVFDLALSPDHVAKTLAGTAVFTVCNSGNEFVLVSDPNNATKSVGILCFRQEDAHALLAQVELRQPMLGKAARVVPITLDQVLDLKLMSIQCLKECSENPNN